MPASSVYGNGQGDYSGGNYSQPNGGGGATTGGGQFQGGNAPMGGGETAGQLPMPDGSMPPPYNPFNNPSQPGYQGPVGPSPGFPGALNYYTAQAGPGLIDIQQGLANSQAQLLNNDASYGLASQYAGQQTGFAGQAYNLGMQGVGIDRNAANRQNTYYGNLAGIDNAQYAQNQVYNGLQSGYLNDRQQSAAAWNQQQSGFASQRLVDQNVGTNAQMSGARASAAEQMRQAKNAATAGGAYTTPGTGQQFSNLNSMRDASFGQIQSQASLNADSENAAIAGFTQNTKEAHQNYLDSMLGLNQKISDQGFSHQTNQLGYSESQAQTQDRLKHLDVTAGQLGLTRNQTVAAINNGLGQAGLSHGLNANILANAITSGTAKQKAIALQIQQQALKDQNFFAASGMSGGGSTGSTSYQFN